MPNVSSNVERHFSGLESCQGLQKWGLGRWRMTHALWKLWAALYGLQVESLCEWLAEWGLACGSGQRLGRSIEHPLSRRIQGQRQPGQLPSIIQESEALRRCPANAASEQGLNCLPGYCLWILILGCGLFTDTQPKGWPLGFLCLSDSQACCLPDSCGFPIMKGSAKTFRWHCNHLIKCSGWLRPSKLWGLSRPCFEVHRPLSSTLKKVPRKLPPTTYRV